MKLATKALYCSLIVVWISVLIKYKSLGLINSDIIEEDPDASSSRRFRFRQAFRKGVDKVIQKVGDKEENTDIDYEDYELSDNSDSRFRDKVRGTYRKIKAHFRVTTQPSKFRPMYNFSSLKDSDEEKHDEHLRKFQHESSKGITSIGQEVQVPYKPGDLSYWKLINLSKNIIRSGNFMRNGINNHDFNAGTYNFYNYRSGDYANVQGSKCANYLEFGGVVFGQYYCPVEGYSLSSTECCGATNEQFCCELPFTQQKSQDDGVEKIKHVYFYILIFCPMLVFILIMMVLVYFARRRICKENYQGVRKDEDNSAEELETS